MDRHLNNADAAPQPRYHGKSVRNYELVANDVAAGRYTIDEGNGVQIAASKIGSALYSNFSVGGQTLTTRYELLDEKPAVLSFELVKSPSEPVKTSRIENLEVVSLEPTTRQTARTLSTQHKVLVYLS